MPSEGNVRPLASRPIMNVKTRDRSAWYATASRSNISAVCSSKVAGTPTGAARVTSAAFLASVRWMRRSISRTLSR